MLAAVLRVLLSASFPSVAAAATPAPAATAIDPAVEAFLAAPHQTFAREHVSNSKRIIVLSQLAEYCAAIAPQEPDGARRCLERLVAIALDTRVSPYHHLDTRYAAIRLGEHGLYLAHLAIVLGAREAVVRDGRYRGLNEHIARHLARLSQADDDAHAPSFPGVRARWPADQSALLFALYVFDRNHDAHYADEPVRRWREVMAKRVSTRYDKLPESELRGVTGTSAIPRGCALSFTVRYTAVFAPGPARALWTRYWRAFAVRLGALSGLREWPAGYPGTADRDSGPIVMNVGAAATGLGLVAAQAVGDARAFRELRATQKAVQALAPRRLRAVGDTILARSIMLVAEHYRRWFDPPPAP